MIKIKVEPTIKPFMYILGHTIHVSYGYLEITSDSHLQFCINHEIGHTFRQSKTILMTFISIVLFVFIFAIAPYWLLFPILSLSYPLFCLYARMGELKADRYAYDIDTSGWDEFIKAEGSRMDKKWIDRSPLYIFRWHPSVLKRLHNIL